MSLKQSIPIVLRALSAKICREILLARKIQADHDAELDAIEKKKQEEELAKKLAEEEAERLRQIELEKKRQALLDNPGFKIVGLKQEYASQNDNSSLSPAADPQFNFQKYSVAYFRANHSLSHSEVGFLPGSSS